MSADEQQSAGLLAPFRSFGSRGLGRLSWSSEEGQTAKERATHGVAVVGAKEVERSDERGSGGGRRCQGSQAGPGV